MIDEFEIIENFFSDFYSDSVGAVVLGSGDDCAILDVPQGYELCVSTDTLISGVHFPVGAPAGVVAHRGLAANVSDLAAMGATPIACMLALTLVEVDQTWLREFSDRLAACSGRWKIPVVGGNLAKGGELSLTFSVMGTVAAGSALKRSGGRAGDGVFVTGSPGEAGAGLALLAGDAAASGPLVDRYYYPEPRIGVGQGLIRLATAAIDVSDGIVADLGHVARASGVDVTLETDAIPLSRELIDAVGTAKARELALSSGDDYELCFSAPPGTDEQLATLAESSGVGIIRIGLMEAGTGVVKLVDENGKPVETDRSGYRHF